MINNLEGKFKKELIEIVNIQVEEYQKLYDIIDKCKECIDKSMFVPEELLHK